MKEDTSQNLKRNENRGQGRSRLVFYLRVFQGAVTDGGGILGHLVNISESGLQLVCEKPVPVNEDFQLYIRLPAAMKEKQELLFAAKSIWCNQDQDPAFYLAGFAFCQPLSVPRDVLQTVIAKFGY